MARTKWPPVHTACLRYRPTEMVGYGVGLPMVRNSRNGRKRESVFCDRSGQLIQFNWAHPSPALRRAKSWARKKSWSLPNRVVAVDLAFVYAGVCVHRVLTHIFLRFGLWCECSFGVFGHTWTKREEKISIKYNKCVYKINASNGQKREKAGQRAREREGECDSSWMSFGAWICVQHTVEPVLWYWFGRKVFHDGIRTGEMKESPKKCWTRKVSNGSIELAFGIGV